MSVYLAGRGSPLGSQLWKEALGLVLVAEVRSLLSLLTAVETTRAAQRRPGTENVVVG